MTTDDERREVARCRDCRHAYRRGGDVYCSRVLQWGSNDRPAPLPVDPDGFCAWGEGSGRVMGPTYSVDVDALLELADDMDAYTECDDERCGKEMPPSIIHDCARRIRDALGGGR